MSKRIKAADLPEFDAAHYLDSETAIAAYLTDILEANGVQHTGRSVAEARSGRTMYRAEG